jgi:hypothetical protein
MECAAGARLFLKELKYEWDQSYRDDRLKAADSTSPKRKDMKNTVCGLRTDKVFVYFT